MTDMIERVARALAECDGLTICSDASYSMSSYGIRAKAAIAAMREPSKDMVRSGYIAIENTDLLDLEPDDPFYSWGREWEPSAIASYEAMIDAALGDKK